MSDTTMAPKRHCPATTRNRERALELLILTAAPEEQRVWREARNDARKVLRAARHAEYATSCFGRSDLRWLEETLRAVDELQNGAPEPEDYGIGARDFVACGPARR